MQPVYDQVHFYKLGRKEKAKVTAKLQRLLANEPRIKIALLFGSVTRREYVRDIDLCISAITNLGFKELLNLNAQIELELGLPVDLVELSTLPPSLKLRILREGILVKGTKTEQLNLLSQTGNIA